MATEISFAKSFLSLLDTKPAKISPDHVEDPRTYPGSTPYTLPRLPSQKPFRRRSSKSTASKINPATGAPSPSASPAPSSPPTVTVLLRSPRNPPFELTLPHLSLTTSLAEVKEKLADETGLPLAKVKVLFGKKPVADSKVLKDLGASGSENEVLELGLMVIGGGSVVMKKKEVVGEGQKTGGEEGEGGQKGEAAAAPVAQGLSGEGVLATGQFWEDLEGFLQQRVRDEGVAGEALRVFRGAWEGRA